MTRSLDVELVGEKELRVGIVVEEVFQSQEVFLCSTFLNDDALNLQVAKVLRTMHIHRQKINWGEDCLLSHTVDKLIPNGQAGALSG